MRPFVNRLHAVTLPMLLWVSFTVRVLGLEAQSLWRDEVDSLRFAVMPLRDYLTQFSLSGQNGPLYFLLLRLWLGLTGSSSAFALRYSSVLWGVLSVALLYTLARRLHGPLAARRAALLLALSPYAIWYAQEVRMYTWVPLLILLALYGLERACTEPRWTWWLLVLVATSLAFYSHILAALVLPVEILWFALRGWSNRRARPGALLVLAGLTLPYLPLARWQIPYALMPRQTGYPALSAWEMAGILLTAWSSGVTGWAALPAVLGSGGLGLLGLVALRQRRQGRLAAALVGWVAGPWLLIALIALRGPIFTDRYLIWSQPGFYLLVACGLEKLQQRWPRLEQGLLALLLLLNSGALLIQTRTPLKPQFREATAYLRAHYAPGDVLFFQIPYNQHVLRYYWGADFPPTLDAPYTNTRAPDGSYAYDLDYVDLELSRLGLRGQRLWFIESEVELWDERALVRTWLLQHGTVLDERAFHEVRLTLLQLPP